MAKFWRQNNTVMLLFLFLSLSFRVARFGILSRDLGNIQGCRDFSREFFSGKKSRENSRDF